MAPKGRRIIHRAEIFRGHVFFQLSTGGGGCFFQTSNINNEASILEKMKLFDYSKDFNNQVLPQNINIAICI